MTKENSIEIKVSLRGGECGLCETAETHWAVYLIQLSQEGVRPTLHTATTADGKEITFIKKGEDSQGSGFTFGAESFLIIASEDPDLLHMLLVEESPTEYSGRPSTPLKNSLEDNGFYDKDTPSRWKNHISHFATRTGNAPDNLTLEGLVKKSLGYD